MLFRPIDPIRPTAIKARSQTAREISSNGPAEKRVAALARAKSSD